MKIGICAPSTPFAQDDANKLIKLAGESHSELELYFHRQCFFEEGHFAGNDTERLSAFVELANDPSVDAVWFVRGGYGACRIAQDAVAQLNDNARAKIYMGYSDAGNMLGALYAADIGMPTHGPMPTDIRRSGGKEAIDCALNWFACKDNASLESSLQSGEKYAAFNLMTLAMMVGTPIMPNLSGHILMVEEVSEHLYAVDRALFNVISHLAESGVAGIQMGRVSDIPENDRPFGQGIKSITQYWCDKYEIQYLGIADIGHDVSNKIVPFGTFA